MVGVTEELNPFAISSYFILMDLNLNNHTWLVATLLESAVLGKFISPLSLD